MKRAIEKELKQMIDRLKPEFKKTLFLFDDKSIFNDEKSKIKLADNISFNPPVIRFYLGSIHEMFRYRLKEIIRHEIIHNFTTDENYAYNKQKDFKIFVGD